MTLSIMTHHNGLNCNTSAFSITSLNITIKYDYAEFCNSECHYPKFRYAERHYAQFCYAERLCVYLLCNATGFTYKSWMIALPMGTML
jgi:hypothetical protein